MSIYLDRIVGRRITGLVVSEGKSPATSLFLSFDDTTYYEFYWHESYAREVEVCSPSSSGNCIGICLDPCPAIPRARRNQRYLDELCFGRTVRVWLGRREDREGPAPDLGPLQRVLGRTVRGTVFHETSSSRTLLAILLDDRTYLEFNAAGSFASTFKIDLDDHAGARRYAAKIGAILLDAEYQPCTTEVVQ